MFDFRYHALSLVSVFLALVLGLLLGVAIGDKGLVSSAERDVRASLRGDVRKAQAQSEDLRAQLDEQNKFLQEAYPLMVGSRLIGERVGVVTLGEVSDSEIGNVRDALEATGGRLTSVASIRTPLNLAALGRSSGAYQNLQSNPKLVKRFGQRVGAGYVAGGGTLLKRVRRQLLASSSGALGGVASVVVIREPRSFQPAQQNVLNDFEDGLMSGLSGNNGTVVGVETTQTDPSQVSWYRGHDLASVDDIDQLPGRAALVFALAGADGAFGTKSSADALLPKAANSLGSLGSSGSP
ncbi:MAG TPA: copper transporter [Solirubrobacteraceae bacterium]|nr:copper transporter [Solirubrobacteraceae bacterium]